YYLISLCGRLSGRLKHCSKGSQMHIHTHTYTRTARVVWWWWCESVQATRTKTMYREREREIDRCLSVCVMWSIYNIYVKQQTNANTLVCVAGWAGLLVCWGGGGGAVPATAGPPPPLLPN